jgi:hypothetical protein
MGCKLTDEARANCQIKETGSCIGCPLALGEDKLCSGNCKGCQQFYEDLKKEQPKVEISGDIEKHIENVQKLYALCKWFDCGDCPRFDKCHRMHNPPIIVILETFLTEDEKKEALTKYVREDVVKFFQELRI